MKEIKFRCYVLDKTGKVECYFYEWLDGDGWKHDYYSPLVTNGVFDHQELGDGFFGEIIRKQYTGLKDKCEVGIYEGDIMNYGAGRVFYVSYVGCQFVATFNERVINSMIPIHNFEIIGNLYENTELTTKP